MANRATAPPLLPPCRLRQIPYFNAPIFLENKTQIGKVDEILGQINSVVSGGGGVGGGGGGGGGNGLACRLLAQPPQFINRLIVASTPPAV